MHASPSVIRTERLTKTFGEVLALDGLDLDVAPGEVHGFLGPNGAGKTTTIRIVLGLIHASGGHVELFGADPWHQAATLHARLAYVAGDVALWPSWRPGRHTCRPSSSWAAWRSRSSACGPGRWQ
jgi:polyether ionophore transport system ATP-binding protein